MIIVNILLATICFSGECYPVLVGNSTPIGKFKLEYKITEQIGYGGDVLEFYESDKKSYSIHRLYLMNRKQNREIRINSNDPNDRIITDGCVNVKHEVFDKLIDCCRDMEIEIK